MILSVLSILRAGMRTETNVEELCKVIRCFLGSLLNRWLLHSPIHIRYLSISRLIDTNSHLLVNATINAHPAADASCIKSFAEMLLPRRETLQDDLMVWWYDVMQKTQFECSANLVVLPYPPTTIMRWRPFESYGFVTTHLLESRQSTNISRSGQLLRPQPRTCYYE